MDTQDLTRKLNSIGKKVFVDYFVALKDGSKDSITRKEAIRLLVEDKVSNEAGASIRVGNAKRIFDEKMELEALEIIISSKRISFETRELAKEIALKHS